ncbi:hypothetical protein DPMN_010367 [Dreissena polymorpha]|uniref:RNase H type-1 domain-containing protein n=1 Tax=Dreissena polymorpha TaxID=45954 RepID=A0A9D4N435_DREPO|nr:hypothetical protein DPMN_010367 [Dreissena polymorpha]
MLQNEDPNTVIAFTDGSCRGNPGPCGAGSCVFLPSVDKVELKQPVSKLTSILVGELVAVKIILQFILEELKKRPIKKVKDPVRQPNNNRCAQTRLVMQDT